MTAVEVVDVACHGPLEVDDARAGAAAAAAAAATAATATTCEATAAAAGRRYRICRDLDFHGNGRLGEILIFDLDRERVGLLRGDIKGDHIADRDLAVLLADLERGRLGAIEAVGELLAILDIAGRDCADHGASLRPFVHEEGHPQGRREHRGVVDRSTVTLTAPSSTDVPSETR